jgi:hypothetical protein
LIKYCTRETPGLVPLTLIDILVVTSPLTTLPEAGEVKHKVTVYAPDAGVLDAQGFVGEEVGVGVGVGDAVGVGRGVEVTDGVGVGVDVGFGVGFPFE